MKKAFDCVELKRKAAAPIVAKPEGMTEAERIDHWVARDREFRASLARARKAASSAR